MQPNLYVIGKYKSLPPTYPVWIRTALGERQKQFLPTPAQVGKIVTGFPNTCAFPPLPIEGRLSYEMIELVNSKASVKKLKTQEMTWTGT